jgi:S1-C subfamily serine protease
MQVMHAITLLLLLVAVTATAAPAPKLVVVEVTRAKIGDLTMTELPASEAEPGGVLVHAGADPVYFAVGLRAGDVIRYVDGTPATGRVYLRDGVTMLEIERYGAPLLLRVLIHGPPTDTKQLSTTDFEDLIARLAQAKTRSTVVRRGDIPSGVRIIDFILELQLGLEIGDIIRSIDSKQIRSDAELVSALQSLTIGPTYIKLERHGRPITLELTRDEPIELSRIKKLGATRYSIPRSVIDALGRDPFVAVRKLDVVPVVAKNVVRGVRIYNMKSDAPAALIGLQNDDIILDVEGRSIASISQASTALGALADLERFTMHLERNGKPLTLAFMIK